MSAAWWWIGDTVAAPSHRFGRVAGMIGGSGFDFYEHDRFAIDSDQVNLPEPILVAAKQNDVPNTQQIAFGG
jgi:hypothetical protein